MSRASLHFAFGVALSHADRQKVVGLGRVCLGGDWCCGKEEGEGAHQTILWEGQTTNNYWYSWRRPAGPGAGRDAPVSERRPTVARFRPLRARAPHSAPGAWARAPSA